MRARENLKRHHKASKGMRVGDNYKQGGDRGDRGY